MNLSPSLRNDSLASGRKSNVYAKIEFIDILQFQIIFHTAKKVVIMNLQLFALMPPKVIKIGKSFESSSFESEHIISILITTIP